MCGNMAIASSWKFANLVVTQSPGFHTCQPSALIMALCPEALSLSQPVGMSLDPKSVVESLVMILGLEMVPLPWSPGH